MKANTTLTEITMSATTVLGIGMAGMCGYWGLEAENPYTGESDHAYYWLMLGYLGVVALGWWLSDLAIRWVHELELESMMFDRIWATELATGVTPSPWTSLGEPEVQSLRGGLRVHWEPLSEIEDVKEAIGEHEAWLEKHGIDLDAHYRAEKAMEEEQARYYDSLDSAWDSVPDVIAADCAEAATKPLCIARALPDCYVTPMDYLAALYDEKENLERAEMEDTPQYRSCIRAINLTRETLT